MKPGFQTIIAAQFLSSLADSALLVAAIGMLQEARAPAWMTPVLKQALVIPYVVLAPLAAVWADAMPKSRVMMISNAMKLGGCVAMLLLLHPLLAYAMVGVGAALFSPAKYGILSEFLPPEQLVIANGWMEGSTVASIVLGVALGGVLVSPQFWPRLLDAGSSLFERRMPSPTQAAMTVIAGVYVLAGLIIAFVPYTGVDPRSRARRGRVLREFAHCTRALWSDPLARVSLATTTLFWGSAATLQLMVIEWAAAALGLDLAHSTWLMAVVTLGIAGGAMAAARRVPLHAAPRVLPIGVVMGLAVIAMVLVHDMLAALAMMVLIGACAGFFVVPMNALLQHRGHQLMGAGHSIAVQNFSENLGILAMVGLYAAMLRLRIPIGTAILVIGGMIVAIMLLVIRQHRRAPGPPLPGGLAAGRPHDG